MISSSSRPGRRRKRLWIVRQVTSTRAPPSGMKRSCRLIPNKTENRPRNFFALEPLEFARGGGRRSLTALKTCREGGGTLGPLW
jgi:hypothetical protein